MIEKAIAELAEALGAPSLEEKPKAHCRDCGAEIDRRTTFCDVDRERRLQKSLLPLE